MIIQHNMMALNANRQFSIVNNSKRKSTEKLSSGYRINRSADDAAGLSISEKMRNQIRGLNQAMENIEDGISLVQVGDGALAETHNILNRIGELAVKAANDVNSSDDRKSIDAEVQQLKTELKSIFQKTEFNGQKLFTIPYIPEISGKPNDIQVFNVASDVHGGYGGVLINHVRYTWEEMGVGFKEDGVTFSGGTYQFNTWDGEQVILNLKEGTTPPNVERVYKWKADQDGIYVNNMRATTWEGMGFDKNNVQAGTYSFDWHGTTISFEVPGGESFLNVIDGFNMKDFNAEPKWHSALSGTQAEKAVDIDDVSGKKVIRDAWKRDLPTTGDYFYLVADEEGVQLKDTRNGSHTKIKWSDFRDVSGTTNSSASNGGYPIVDWGVTNGSNGYSSVTLDNDATYHYSDAVTGLEFDFKLSDEASRVEVISGLSQNKITQSIVAPVQAKVTAGANQNFKLSASVVMPYDLQYKTGKSFDNWNTPFGTSYSVTKTASGYDLEYKLNTNETRTMKASITAADFRSKLINGGTLNVGFTEESGKTDFGFGLRFEIKKFDDSQVRADYATWLAANPGASEQDKDDKYNELYEQHLGEYADSAYNYLRNATIQTVQTEQPYQVISISEKSNQSIKSSFDAVLDPIEKSAVIQSGANKGETTTIRWNCMTVSILGMGGTNVLDRASAEEAISQVQRSIKMISGERSKFGAAANRLEKSFNNNANYSENLQSAESNLRDTDMADEMAIYSKHNILEQAGQAMLAQANQMNQSVLQLLQ